MENGTVCKFDKFCGKMKKICNRSNIVKYFYVLASRETFFFSFLDICKKFLVARRTN